MKALGNYAFLWQLKGRSVRRIRRVMYVLRGEISAETGPVEITTTDGRVLLLDAASDGEALSVKASAWIDQFAEPLSAENREFIERSGRWMPFDVSRQPPYSQMIGQLVDDITAIRNPENKITGIVIKIADRAMRIEVEADEVSVDIA